MNILTDVSPTSEALSAQPSPDSNTAETYIPAATSALLTHPNRIPHSVPRIANGADGLAIIDIFRKPDFPTVLDGASRYFLQTMQDMATQDIAIVTEDFAHLANWWRENVRAIAADAARAASGIKITAKDILVALDHGTTSNPAKDAAINTGMQSLFARTAEVYLTEAMAPSPGMRGVLEQFRDWLLSIYRRLVTLDISLAPDVAAIFFRLLACDTAVEMAQADVGSDQPVFANSEAAGLTQPQYDRLLKMRALASQEAKARMLRQMMEPVRRERQKAYKAEKAGVRRAVEKEIDATGLYRAIEWMTNRRWLDTETPAPAGEISFDKTTLVARYGAAVLEALPQGEQTVYSDDGGLDPDIVADLFGLGSGDELVAAMALVPSRAEAIASEVERVMLQRHGDMLIDGLAEERAIAAIHNDRRAEWLAAELKAIVDIAGDGDGMTVREAEAYALSATAGMEVADAMDGARFLAAGRRTGMEAARLGHELAQEQSWRDRASMRTETAGNGEAQATTRPEDDDRISKLVTAKRRQLLNHAIYAESLKIAREVQTFEAKARELASGPSRESIAEASRGGEGSIDYLAAIDTLLGRTGLDGATGARNDAGNGLRDFLAAMKAAGRENELAIPDSVRMGSRRQSYKTISLERFRAVRTAIENLDNAARRAGRLIDAGNAADFEETVSRLLRALERPMPAETAERRRHLDPTLEADAILRSIDAAEHGPAHEAIKAPLDAAVGRLMLRKQKAAADLAALYDIYSSEERRDMAIPRYLPALGRAISKWDAIAIALNTGNETNRRRLTDGRAADALDEAGLATVLGVLEARDGDFVQSVWDMFAGLHADIATREKRLTGVEPQWVEPTPVMIGGKLLRGGYYPLVYDGADTAQDIFPALVAGRFAKAATAAGHARARTDLIGRPLDLDIVVLHRQINRLLYDLELCEPLSNIARLLSDDQLQAAFSQSGRAADARALEEWLHEAGTRELRSADLVGRTGRLSRKHVTAAKLANDLAEAFLCQAGLGKATAAIGKCEFLIGFDAALRTGAMEEVSGRSPLMAQRRHAIFQENGTTVGPYDQGKDEAWQQIAVRLAETLKYRFMDMPLWLTGFYQALRQSGDDETSAIAHADNGMKSIRPAALPDAPTAFSQLLKGLVIYLAGRYDVAPEAVHGRDAGEDTPARQAMSLAIDLAALFTIDAVCAAVVGRHPSAVKDDGDRSSLLAERTGYSVMVTLPFIRDAEILSHEPEDGSSVATLAAIVAASHADVAITEPDASGILELMDLAAAPADEINRRVEQGLRRLKPSNLR